MAERRFNIGRQGEQLMNDKLFKAYNRIKYVGNGAGTPTQEYQAPIQDFSLWVDPNEGYDVLKRYNQTSKQWSPMFKGYYHPACLTEQPMYPVEGQAYIDLNGVVRYYEDKQWKVAKAATATNLSNASAGISNFLLMPDMKPITGSDRDYLIPYLSSGKLFDNKKYMSTEKFDGTEIRLTYPLMAGTHPTEKVSWVHVNPAYLYNADKRLIKILDSIKTDNWFINVPTTNTEFYGVINGEPKGTLLRYIPTSYKEAEGDISSETTDTISDYRKVSGGIQLINAGRTYDYIYAITYKFDSVDQKFGYVLHDNVTIGDNNEVFVGQIKGFPLVFLNGLYLEQADYKYTSNEGMLAFSGETITNNMDLTVAAFADVVRYTTTEYPGLEPQQIPPFELTVTASDISAKGTIIKSHEYIKQASRFKHPIAFVQGVASLYDPGYGITDEVEIDAASGMIKVYNYGPLAKSISAFSLDGDSDNLDEGTLNTFTTPDFDDGAFLSVDNSQTKILIADIGDAKMSSGLTSNGAIIDANITDTCSYIAFINGVCTSPSDHIVSIGKIESEGITSGQQYILMSLDKGDTGIDLLFDAPISYFTAQINDNNASTVYNDCNMVVSYVYDDAGLYNGILLDQNYLTQTITTEKAYSTGEIIKVLDSSNESEFAYIYKIFNLNGDFSWTNLSQADIFKIEQMVTQFNGAGSISIMSNASLKGKKLAYYAYTFADEVDEAILSGKSTAKIAVQNHIQDTTIPSVQDFYVSRTHYYSPPGKGVLATYINGIQVKSTDSETVECKYHIDTPSHNNYVKCWGTSHDLYPLLKEINTNTSLIDLENFKAGKYSEQLKEYSVNVSLLEKLKGLAKAILESETNNELAYFVEKLEAGETFSVDRSWTSWANRYAPFDNTYTSLSYIGPGSVNVYLNGVMLDKSSYSIFDNNNIILNDLTPSGGSDEWTMENDDSHRMIKYYVEEYDETTGKTKGNIYRLLTETPDEVMIEYRPDTTVKKVSYEIKDTTYDTNGVLSYEDYSFPNSLITTKDTIKIYIDGILYTGGYKIDKKDVVLTNCPLQLDPIQQYFNAHPDIYKEWKRKNGEYVYKRSRIIFEWR